MGFFRLTSGSGGAESPCSNTRSTRYCYEALSGEENWMRFDAFLERPSDRVLEGWLGDGSFNVSLGSGVASKLFF